MTENKVVGNIEIKHKVIITETDVDDILTTALEGGINYWCTMVVMDGERKGETNSEHLINGGTLTFYEDLYEDGSHLEPHGIRLDNLLLGIELYENDDYIYSGDIVVTNGADWSIDTGMVDAEVADAIIQLTIFNEIVYG